MGKRDRRVPHCRYQISFWVGIMKRIFCDLCRREIHAADIYTEIPLNVGGKEMIADMHSACYYRFIRELGKMMEEEDDESDNNQDR